MGSPPVSSSSHPWMDDDFLRTMLKKGDEPADRIARRLMKDADYIYPFMSRLKDMRNLVAAGRIEPEFMDRYFRERHDGEPEWVDHDSIEIAQDLFNRNAIKIIICLFAASLPECYGVECEAQVLHHTQQLRKEAAHRVRQTGRLIFAVLDRHGLDKEPPNGDPRWLSGRMAALQVRILHAIMRCRLAGDELAPPPEPEEGLAPEYQDVKKWLDSFAPPPIPEGVASHPIYLNQVQLAYTLLTFSYVTVRSLRIMGVRWTKTEVDAYIHTWNFVGWILGVDSRLMAWSFPEAEELFSRLKTRLLGESSGQEKGQDLVSALVEMLKKEIPGELADSLPAATMRHLLDEQTAATLNLPESAGGELGFKILSGVIRILHGVAGKAGQSIPIDQALADLVDFLRDTRTEGFSLNLEVDPMVSEVRARASDGRAGDGPAKFV